MEISLRQTAQRLMGANSLVITGHINPDGDCLGSMLALYTALASAGKNVRMLLDDDVPPVYRFLPEWQAIGRAGDTVADVDLLVVVDASDLERIATVRQAVNAPILNIDHHISNTRFADYWHIDHEATATGEIILDLLRLMELPVTKDIAVCLYTAIATDCGFFRYANTSAATLRHAADLVEIGVQPHIICEALDTKPLSSITTLTRVLESLEVRHEGRIASVFVTADMLEDGQESTEGFINYPRNIEGVELAILFKPADNETTRVSFRSRDIDVSGLALSFGGGGHARAAGCTVSGGLDEARSKVFEAAEKLLMENGL